MVVSGVAECARLCYPAILPYVSLSYKNKYRYILSYPTFSKAGMTTLVFSRGNVYPDRHVYQPRQVVARSEAGQTRVATLSEPDETFPLVFERLPLVDYEALRSWLLHPTINWQASSFTYTDTAGVATVVRYVDTAFDLAQVAPGRFSGAITLRREPF
jgi:hypothetical protein